MRTAERTQDLARAAVVNLLRAEREWRKFFRDASEASVSRLWAIRYQFRDELQKRGEWHSLEEIGDVLLALAREKLPESAAARWDAQWSSRLCTEALQRLGEHFASLTEAERVQLDLSGQEGPEEAMNAAGLANAPAAFRVALKAWERAGLEALNVARSRKSVAS